jgi:integrase
MGEARPAPDEAIRTTLARADVRQTFMLLLGAVGGLRRKEIASVHSSHLEGDELRVHGRERVVPLPPALARRRRRMAVPERIRRPPDQRARRGAAAPHPAARRDAAHARTHRGLGPT